MFSGGPPRQSVDDVHDRPIILENGVGINIPRICSAESEMKDIRDKIQRFEARMQPNTGMDVDEQTVASHRGAGTLPPATSSCTAAAAPEPEPQAPCSGRPGAFSSYASSRQGSRTTSVVLQAAEQQEATTAPEAYSISTEPSDASKDYLAMCQSLLPEQPTEGRPWFRNVTRDGQGGSAAAMHDMRIANDPQHVFRGVTHQSAQAVGCHAP